MYGVNDEKDFGAIPPDLRSQLDQLEEKIRKDSLSGLLNRATVESYVEQRLADMAPDELCALFIVDLDNFKQVNDILGHPAGDQAIRQSAQILSSLFRASDIVGRLGGDEFAVFLSGRLTEQLIRQKAQAICQRLQLVLGDNRGIVVTASVGVHISRGGSQRFAGLYQSADLALYKAKKNGKHGFCINHSENSLEGSAADNSFTPVSTIPLNRLLESMESGVALLEMGESPRVIYLSPSFYRILGADAHSFTLPRPISDFVHPDDRAELESELRSALQENRAAEYIHRGLSQNGGWFWWRIRAVQIDYSSPYPVMLVTTTDVSRFKEKENKLRTANQRYQAALKQTTQKLWEVDIQSQVFTLFSYGEDSSRHPKASGISFPEELIRDGWIHPSSASHFREFASGLLEGRSCGHGNFIIRHQETGCYGWAALSYQVVFDQSGLPFRAMGTAENLPQSYTEQETRSVLNRPLPEAQIPNLIIGMQANLSLNTVKGYWVEGREPQLWPQEGSCSQALAREAENIFSANDRQTLAPYFDRQSLLNFFAQNKLWLSQKYRRVDGDGNICWVRYTANLAQDFFTGEVYLFLYISLWDQHYRWEQALPHTVVRDSVTGLYDSATTQQLITSLLHRQGRKRCSLALIQIGGLDQLYASDSSPGDHERRYIAEAFAVALGAECVIGQHTPAQLLAFFPDIQSKTELRRRLEEAFIFVRLVLTDSLPMDTLRLVAGAVCLPANQADCETMLRQASRLCQLLRSASTDQVAFPQEEDDWSWDELQFNSDTDHITVHQAEMARSLSDSEKDVALQVISSMLTADSLDDSMYNTLSQIGGYYHADRVYLLRLTENQLTITMPYEWVGRKKHSIQQAVSGMPLSSFPFLNRCIQERSPVFLSRTQPAFQQGPEAEEPWYFTAFPLIDGADIWGVLCIENARKHPADAALFSAIIPHLLREPQRFRSGHSPNREGTIELSEELPNLRSYLQVIYRFSSDHYSSLGVVCLDIPGLSAINGSQGFAYGSKLLRYVSEVLTNIFGPSLIFRTWDMEFVALCPNTTREVFIRRCERLKAALQRRYPKTLRLGHSWSTGIFNGKDMVDEARTIMRCQEVTAKSLPEMVSSLSNHFRSTRDALRAGHFTVFYQPKIDIRTGILHGAEALVRGLDEEGNLIPPGQFIEFLEQNGGIRELDLFVFEQVLAAMEQWRAKGLGIIPISVNFSRVTLFTPSVLGSVLALQSRYPNIPPAALELEITESASNVETSDLSAVMEQFRELGLHFALDDFGSQYANIPVFTNVRFDTVKLDRSLIAELTSNPINQMLIQDIVRICRVCGMTCVAEGVETQYQQNALAEIGCVYAQGYYYDRPLEADKFEEKYLRASKNVKRAEEEENI